MKHKQNYNTDWFIELNSLFLLPHPNSASTVLCVLPSQYTSQLMLLSVSLSVFLTVYNVLPHSLTQKFLDFFFCYERGRRERQREIYLVIKTVSVTYVNWEENLFITHRGFVVKPPNLSLTNNYPQETIL